MSATDDATHSHAPHSNRWLTLALAALAGAAIAAVIALLAAPADPPLSEAWWRWMGGGALLGALGSLAAAAIGLALRHPRRRAARARAVERDAGATDAWLHVVSGPGRAVVARAVMELAAHALARRQRVLVIDAGAKLALHERFGREARWGLAECLAADMPLLGLVQYGGRPGLYLLAHGRPGRGQRWAGLGRRLDDAHPHFGRIVLALDSAAPAEIGDALRGRTFEAWWAGLGSRARRGREEISDRLGMSFSAIELSGIPEAALEVMAEREQQLERRLPPAPPPKAAPRPALAGPIASAPAAPAVLDCDLQVQQRLRFLAWMRQVQSEMSREREEVLS